MGEAEARGVDRSHRAGAGRPPYANLLPGGVARTTFWQDFIVANHRGRAGVVEAFERALSVAKGSIGDIAELGMACAWMSRGFLDYWEGTGDGEAASAGFLYDDLYERVNARVYDSVHEEGGFTRDDIVYYHCLTH